MYTVRIDRDNDWAPLGTTKVAAVAEMLKLRILVSGDLQILILRILWLGPIYIMPGPMPMGPGARRGE